MKRAVAIGMLLSLLTYGCSFHVKTPIVIDYQKYESIHPGIKKNDIELLLGSPQPDHTGATHLNTHQSPYHIIIKLSDPIIKLFGRSQRCDWAAFKCATG